MTKNEQQFYGENARKGETETNKKQEQDGQSVRMK